MSFGIRLGLEPTSAIDRLGGRFLTSVTLGSLCLEATMTFTS